MLEPQKLLLIMFPQKSINLDSFHKKNLTILVDSIQSKQDNTFFMNIEGSTITGIQDRIH